MEVDTMIRAAAASLFAVSVLLTAVDRWRAYRARRAWHQVEAWLTRRGLLLRAKVAQRLREAGHRWDGRA